LANWVRLEDLTTGIEFRVVNTHLDHVSQAARQNQARLIVEDAAAYPAGYPQVLTGDMNCDYGNAAIDTFKTGGWIDTYGTVHDSEDPGFTYHGFLGPGFVSEIAKMDWVFMRGKLTASHAEVIRDSRDGRFPSDYYFVSATFDLEPS
jgi:endonuclease/exonuclease/phosphatase family metal-dependent hydrolase